ncbi:MAG: YraN family protein [Candidatus Daviesbacteria bacterium]|nr:YraN family protein [Candidatus Daviesbacteria bacterium]
MRKFSPATAGSNNIIMSTTDVGNKGEYLACEYLKKLGYKILERNYRIRGGEIDIVAQDNNFLVFIEVKTRYTSEFGLPVESMTPWKIKILLRTARFYIQLIDWGDQPYRLDFVGIDYTCPDKGGANNQDNPEIELIKDITS